MREFGVNYCCLLDGFEMVHSSSRLDFNFKLAKAVNPFDDHN